MADDAELVEGFGRKLRSVIPQSGHPTGFYMAALIEQELGSDAIVKVVRNPFRFFYLYNEAAKKNGNAPVFSSKATAFVRSLERKYAKPIGTEESNWTSRLTFSRGLSRKFSTSRYTPIPLTAV
jgi:hypothetical protein